jgi:uncharacterized protein (TIGR00369 family)
MTDAPRHADSLDELAPREVMTGMDGIDFFRAMIAGRLPAAPIARTLNFRLVAADPGRVVFRGAPEFAAMNPMRTVHGGWYATILDSCMACAVQSLLKAGQAQTTLELKINLIRAVPLGMEVEAVGTAVHVGRSTGVAEGRLTGIADGKVYATGSTTCLVMTL